MAATAKSGTEMRRQTVGVVQASKPSAPTWHQHLGRWLAMADKQGSRRFDDGPETDADLRFFELRESGYGGWIDQDGYPVSDVDAWIADNGITALTIEHDQNGARS